MLGFKFWCTYYSIDCQWCPRERPQGKTLGVFPSFEGSFQVKVTCCLLCNIRQSSDSHCYTLDIEWPWITLHWTLYYIAVTSRYTEAFKLHCFLKKKSIQYISIILIKCGFELHIFFWSQKQRISRPCCIPYVEYNYLDYSLFNSMV